MWLTAEQWLALTHLPVNMSCLPSQMAFVFSPNYTPTFPRKKLYRTHLGRGYIYSAWSWSNSCWLHCRRIYKTPGLHLPVLEHCISPLLHVHAIKNYNYYIQDNDKKLLPLHLLIIMPWMGLIELGFPQLPKCVFYNIATIINTL